MGKHRIKCSAFECKTKKCCRFACQNQTEKCGLLEKRTLQNKRNRNGKQYYMDLFEKLKLSNKPFLFYVIKTDDSGKIVYQGSTSENEKPYYTLKSYTIDEDAEQYGIDASVSLSLKQYRSYGTATGSIQIEQYGQSASISNKRDTTGKQTAKSYTVKKGDTLWNICKKELGDGTKYKEIAQKNGIATPNKIYPGQVINLE